MTRNDTRIIHTDGLEEGIRCAMCTNPMANNRGCDGGCDINESMYKRVLDVIKKNILEQEPCEDAVSRTDVLELIEDINDTVFGQVVSKGIMNLPSVRPKEKVGHWITEYDRWGDIVTTISHYQCSECKQYDYDKDNYCPNCGCYMIEPQESEVKE